MFSAALSFMFQGPGAVLSPKINSITNVSKNTLKAQGDSLDWTHGDSLVTRSTVFDFRDPEMYIVRYSSAHQHLTPTEIS